jgi:membrane protease YdiL (CAAX protease family)
MQPYDQRVAAEGTRAWGFWATLAWIALALLLHDGFGRLEIALLRGTAFGHAIDRSIVLGAFNIALVWSIPLIVLVVAVRLRGHAVRDYFGWVLPSIRYVVLGVVLALAMQLAFSGILYLLGADWSGAVEQYRVERAAGASHWIPVLQAWPAIVCAPIIEESVFRGFLWRGWARSRLAAAGTLWLGTLVFAAWHIPKAMDTGNAVAGSIMLVQVFVLGLFLSWLRWRSGGTTAGILAHAAANAYPPLVVLVIGALLA